jgi:hypothetical protein
LDPLPRLFDGVDGDCGAGLDFLVLTSDKKVKACSFQTSGFDVETADDVLRVWRERRAHLLGPAPHSGCARPKRPSAPLADGLRVWQSFSANNSGDCVLVGRFDEVGEAEAYLAELLPGFAPGAPFSDEWKALLGAAGISVQDDELAPDEMGVLGRNVMLHTDSALDDDFPSLRALLWKRGGRAVYTGIHVHEPLNLAMGFRFPDAATLEAAQQVFEPRGDGVVGRRGLDMYCVEPLTGPVARIPLHQQLEQLAGFAEKRGAPFRPRSFQAARTSTWRRRWRLPPRGVEHLWVSFRDAEAAASHDQPRSRLACVWR